MNCINEVDAFQIVLGMIDIAGAFVLLWCAQRITVHAGWRTTVERWAMVRRITYFLSVFALFVLGINHLGVAIQTPVQHAAQIIVVVSLILFPILRAAGIITQDFFGWPMSMS